MTLPKDSTEHHVMQRVTAMLPKFEDIFDEETFYICAIVLAIIAIVGAIIASRHVTLKDAGHVD